MSTPSEQQKVEWLKEGFYSRPFGYVEMDEDWAEILDGMMYTEVMYPSIPVEDSLRGPRSPKYPAIVIANDGVHSAFNDRQLIRRLSDLIGDDRSMRIVDCRAEEFIYISRKLVVLPVAAIPGIRRKKWTKQQIIDLLNDSETAKAKSIRYSPKSLSHTRLTEVIADVCNLLTGIEN